MAVTISYKNSKISEINNSNTRTLETAGKYCESNIIVNYNKEGNKIVEGNSSIVITDAEEGDICALTQYGACEQDSSTNAISCNNGVLSISSGEIITTGTNETVTIGSQTATIENLYSVGNIKDEQEIVTGRVTRKNDICIYDGTQPVGDRYISSTGAKDNGAIIIYPREEEYTNENVVSFNKNTEEDINSLEVSISPIQNLNGYSNPWPGGGGANKLNMSAGTVGSASYYNKSAGTTLVGNGSAATITGTNPIEITNTSNYRGGLFFSDVLENGKTYALRFRITGENNSNIKRTVYLVDSDNVVVSNLSHSSSVAQSVDYVYVIRITPTADNLRAVFAVESSTTQTITIYDMGLNDPDTDTAFYPYANICPISGRTGLTVYRTGKNLCDIDKIIIGKCVRAGHVSDSSPLGSEMSNASWSCSDFVRVAPSTQYTTSVPLFTSATAAGLVFFDKYKNALSGVPTYMQHDMVYTFTTPADCSYVRFSWNNANGNEAQIAVGSESAYTPYIGQTYSVDWSTQAGTVYGGTLDVVTGVLTVDRIGITPEVTHLQSINAYGIANFAFDLPQNARNTNAISNVLKTQTSPIASTTEQGISIANAFIGYVRLDSAVASTQEQANTWISDNGLLLVYKLSTPLTYQLTGQEVQTLVGQNNIFSPDATSIKVAVSNPRIEQVTPQPLTLVEGDNTITATNLNVSSVPLELEYIANGDNLLYGSNTSNYVNAGAADYMII